MRHPYTVSQSVGNYGEYEADKAYIKLTMLKKAAILALRNIYKVASHTFHVYLWDLMLGARTNESHVFTRVKESRKQYLVQARLADASGLKLKPHSAKDTLDFLKKHFVKESSNQVIIKWMDILRHSNKGPRNQHLRMVQFFRSLDKNLSPDLTGPGPQQHRTPGG
jgi:hypothetical protein